MSMSTFDTPAWMPRRTTARHAVPARVVLTHGRDSYKWLWIKQVRAVDLARHCGGCLVGPYCDGVDATTTRPQAFRLVPEEGMLAWYVCGVVPGPHRERNAHLAFVPAPGRSWEGLASPAGGQSTLHVTLEDAVPVLGWGAHSIDPAHRYAAAPAYASCRAWQFAHHLAAARAAAAPGPPSP